MSRPEKRAGRLQEKEPVPMQCREAVRMLTQHDRQGKEQKFLLRVSRSGDEEGMIACIRDEYGDTYFKRELYRPAYMRLEAESGHITFLVAEAVSDDKRISCGEIAGMLILKEFYPEESMCEIASQIFRRKYRGFGLAEPFFAFGMEILLSRNYTAAYCLPVLFHDVTQRLLRRQGLIATGLVLNVFDTDNITHSYHNGRNTKHSQGIQIRAVGKRDAGMLYLPEECRDFCRTIYERLGVRYRIWEKTASSPMGGTPPGSLSGCRQEAKRNGGRNPPRSRISARQDDRQSSLEIRVHRTGADLPEQMKALHDRYPLRGKQTANVFLNINDRNAVWAYRRLREAGYFFTGLKPLCSDREYMVLHHAGEVKMWLEDYAVTEEFKELIIMTRIKGEKTMAKIERLETEEWIAAQKAAQSELIDMLINEMNDVKDKEQEQRFRDEIEDGICYMLSLEWLRLIITGSDEWRRNFGVADNAEKLGYYKQLANNFIAYAEETQTGLRSILLEVGTLADDQALYELCTAKAVRIKDKEVTLACPDRLTEVLLGDEKFMTIRLLMPDAGHRVAAYRLNETTLYFYDPNIGTVQVHGDNAAELKKEVKELISNIWQIYLPCCGIVRFAESAANP